MHNPDTNSPQGIPPEPNRQEPPTIPPVTTGLNALTSPAQPSNVDRTGKIGALSEQFERAGSISATELLAVRALSSKSGTTGAALDLARKITDSLLKGGNPISEGGTDRGIGHLCAILAKSGPEGAELIWSLCCSTDWTVSRPARQFFARDLSEHPELMTLLVDRMKLGDTPRERALAVGCALQDTTWDKTPALYHAVIDRVLDVSFSNLDQFHAVRAIITPARLAALTEREDFEVAKNSIRTIFRFNSGHDKWEAEYQNQTFAAALLEQARRGKTPASRQHALHLLEDIGPYSPFSLSVGDALVQLNRETGHSPEMKRALARAQNMIFYDDPNGISREQRITAGIATTSALVAAGAYLLGVQDPVLFTAAVYGPLAATTIGGLLLCVPKMTKAEHVWRGGGPKER